MTARVADSLLCGVRYVRREEGRDNGPPHLCVCAYDSHELRVYMAL